VLDRALEMNGNSALAFGFSALVCTFSERFERAIEHAQKALRLSPFDPLNYHPYLALAFVYLFTDRFEEAVTCSTLGVQANPGFSLGHALLVASHANLDRLDAARAAAQRLIEIAPDFTVTGFLRMNLVRPSLMNALAEALRKAALPD
jgi:adenylate cyclase